MYLNHQLVPGFQIVLRNGEERDREYLASVFTEVWAGIPEKDRAAILGRSYGRITVDVQKGAAKLRHMAGKTEGLELSRILVDTSPRNVLIHFVARDFAGRVHDFVTTKAIAHQTEPRQNAKRRIISILERWGYPRKVHPELTPADELRIQANQAAVQREQS
jgi:hypothetical protein